MIQQYWNVQHIRDGKVIWEEKDKHNSLSNQGALAILQTFYQGISAVSPTTFYVRLCNYSPTVLDTISSIQNEPNGNGYSAQPIAASVVGFPTVDTAPDGNPRLTSAVVTFSASGGNIGPVTTAFLTTDTNILVGFLPLSMQRTILNGDAMTYQFYVEEGNA
jgi:hypothetical protein